MSEEPEPANFIVKAVVVLLILLVGALIRAGERAIVMLNDAVVKRDAEDGDKKAKRVLRLTKKSDGFMAAIHIADVTMLLAVVLSFFHFFNADIMGWISGVTNSSVVQVLIYFAVFVLLLFFCFLFGDMLPKQVAAHRCEKTAYALLTLVELVSFVFLPFAKINGFISGVILRIFGIDPNADVERVTEEEILMMVDAGEERGVIEESQKEMINNIFEFDDIAASDVMTHRTDIVTVDIEDTIDDVIHLATEEGYSRIPVYEGDIDNIKGIIYVKDLLKFVGAKLPAGGLGTIMREAFFVPESKRCGDLFTEMTEKRIQMCIVSDEYGGTAGLVTIEDLLESIVGNIQDEYDDEEEDEIEQIDESTFTVDGTTDTDEVAERLDIELPEGDFDTVGGMIMSAIGRIPEENEHPSIEVSGYLFTVEEMGERRIERVTIQRLPSQED